MATNSSGEFSFANSNPASLDEFQSKFNNHTDAYVHTVRPKFPTLSFPEGVWNSS